MDTLHNHTMITGRPQILITIFRLHTMSSRLGQFNIMIKATT